MNEQISLTTREAWEGQKEDAHKGGNSASDPAIGRSAETEMAEEWRPVAGFEGRYEVSDQGRFRSLRFVNRHLNYLRESPKIMKGRVNFGYVIVTMGRSVARRLNRLVLETFIGPAPEGFQAAHQNGVRADNRLKNLKWMHGDDNNRQRAEHGTQIRGEEINTAILTEAQVSVIKRRLLTEERACAKIGRQYGVHEDTISAIRKGRNWKHVLPAPITTAPALTA